MRLAAPLLLFVASCSGRTESLTLPLGTLERDLALVGIFDANERLEQSLLFELDDATQSPLRLSLPEGGRVFGLAFDRSDLVSENPRLDVTRWSDLRLVEASASSEVCPEGHVVEGGRHTRQHAPSATLGFGFDEEEGKLLTRSTGEAPLRNLALEIPINPSSCQSNPQLAFQDFALDTKPIRGGITVGNETVVQDDEVRLFAIHRLDENRLLALYRRYLVLLHQGESFQNEPARVLVPADGQQFITLAVAPKPGAVGEHRVIVVTRSSTLADTTANLLELTLSESGLGAAREIFESNLEIGTAHLSPSNGRLVAYMAPTTILTESEVDGSLIVSAELPLQDFTPSYGARFQTTELRTLDTALLGSHRGGFFLGDVASGDWRLFSQGLEPGFGVSALASTPHAGQEPDLWVGNDGGFLYRGSSSEPRWDRIDVRLDPSLIAADCANPAEDTCGFAIPRHQWVHLTRAQGADGQVVLVGLPDLCSVAYVIQPSGCVSHFSFAEGEEQFRSVEDEIAGAVRTPGRLTFFTERGAIYELVLD